jgi:hypothetical protein
VATKKTIVTRAEVIEKLVADMDSWEPHMFKASAKETRAAELAGMTNKELLEEAGQALLEGHENWKFQDTLIDESHLGQKILDAATSHGEDSEPDQEVGDLQAAVLAAWKELTPAARRKVFDSLDIWES